MNIKTQLIIASMAMSLVISLPSQAGNGSELYSTYCAACHGTSGKGDLPGAPDFTSESGPLSKDDVTLQANINNGFQSPGSSMPMPAKGGNPNLSADEIKELVKFLKGNFLAGGK